MKIYLIGMMLSGKTKIGKKLAPLLRYQFVDTDLIIEEKYNLSIPKFIQKHGMDYFRQVEKQTLSDITQDNTVISTGGGIILDHDNIQFMKKEGIVIYLKYTVEELEKYLTHKSKKTRPLLQKQSLQSIFEARKAIYENAATMKIMCNGLTIDEIVNLIINNLEID